MADPFLGEIRLMSFQTIPKGWAACNGQVLPISQNPALFSLLGTTYGGNGQTTFALPDLRDRAPLHTGAGISLGERGGEAAHTLTVAELPAHTHPFNATDASSTTNATGASSVLATSTGDAYYSTPSDLVAFSNRAIVPTGGGQAHENRQPFLVANFCIATTGIFPSHN